MHNRQIVRLYGMSRIGLCEELQGRLGETVFEHFCNKRGYAYIRLEDIYNTLTPQGVLLFQKGFKRFAIQIPESIMEEVRLFSKPSNRQHDSPSFVYDYLTFSLWGNKGDGALIRNASKEKFNWVEVKTGRSKLSRNQRNYRKRAKIPVQLFRIDNHFPERYEVTWEDWPEDER